MKKHWSDIGKDVHLFLDTHSITKTEAAKVLGISYNHFFKKMNDGNFKVSEFQKLAALVGKKFSLN